MRAASVVTAAGGEEDRAPASPGAPPQTEQGIDLNEVFLLVREREGIDLRAYRRGTVVRRIESRLRKLRCQDHQEYVRRLAEDPEEARRLVEHVTIKVSRFFRNADVFARLHTEVLPDLARQAGGDGPRIWSAGCGHGQEAYSLAILVEEMARHGRPLPEAAIYGTDVDAEALAVARRGLYPEAALAETPPEFVATYFEPRPERFGLHYEVLPTLRERVEFLHQDLLSGTDAPELAPFHLILCRNVLIYFERSAQERVFDLLAASLAPGGYLCLGEAEQVLRAHQRCFETVDRRAGLYRRVGSALESEGKHAAA